MELQTPESHTNKRSLARSTQNSSDNQSDNLMETSRVTPEANTDPEVQATLSDKDRKSLETSLPMWKIVLNQFFEHRMAVAGLVVICAFLAVAMGADLIAWATGLNPNKQNVSARYLLPMTRSEASTDTREATTEVWLEAHPELATKVQTEIVEKNLIPGVSNQDAIYELMLLEYAQSKPKIALLSGESQAAMKDLAKDFSTYHVFGTDEVGRDVLIRLVYGTRVSIGVGIMVALVSALMGLMIGSVAGFYGGWLDSLLMRITDALLSLPLVPVLIVFAAIDLTKLPFLDLFISNGNESIFKMVVILCLFSWMTVARLVRGSILSLREREFILASKTLGAKDSTIIVRHMFPNVIAPMLVSITLGIGNSILFEAALSFLGLGIMPPTPSWGNMLNNAQEVMYKNVWLAVLPGLLIFLTVVSFNFLGDGLQDAIDPKAVRR